MKTCAFALCLSGLVIFIQGVNAGYGRGKQVRSERPEFSLVENQPEVNWISFVARRFLVNQSIGSPCHCTIYTTVVFNVLNICASLPFCSKFVYANKLTLPYAP